MAFQAYANNDLVAVDETDNVNDLKKKLKSGDRKEIVVDRLLTGFDAPCMSAIFIDRQPMGFHDLIQAFSRTNRIYDKNKAYGQIVTFQAPVLFKKCVDEAVKLYSAGGDEGGGRKSTSQVQIFCTDDGGT